MNMTSPASAPDARLRWRVPLLAALHELLVLELLQGRNLESAMRSTRFTGAGANVGCLAWLRGAMSALGIRITACLLLSLGMRSDCPSSGHSLSCFGSKCNAPSSHASRNQGKVVAQLTKFFSRNHVDISSVEKVQGSRTIRMHAQLPSQSLFLIRMLVGYVTCMIRVLRALHHTTRLLALQSTATVPEPCLTCACYQGRKSDSPCCQGTRGSGSARTRRGPAAAPPTLPPLSRSGAAEHVALCTHKRMRKRNQYKSACSQLLLFCVTCAARR
jgi:hypothetical protein